MEQSSKCNEFTPMDFILYFQLLQKNSSGEYPFHLAIELSQQSRSIMYHAGSLTATVHKEPNVNHSKFTHISEQNKQIWVIPYMYKQVRMYFFNWYLKDKPFYFPWNSNGKCPLLSVIWHSMTCPIFSHTSMSTPKWNLP